MGISPQQLRDHLKQTMREALDMPAPKRHRDRPLRNWSSDGSSDYDTSEETERNGPNYTANRERFWRSIRKQVANHSRINVRN